MEAEKKLQKEKKRSNGGSVTSLSIPQQSKQHSHGMKRRLKSHLVFRRRFMCPKITVMRLSTIWL